MSYKPPSQGLWRDRGLKFGMSSWGTDSCGAGQESGTQTDCSIHPSMPPYLEVLTSGGPQPRQRPSVVLHEATLIVCTNWLNIDSGQRPPVQWPSTPRLLLTLYLALLPLAHFLLVILASLLFLYESFSLPKTLFHWISPPPLSFAQTSFLSYVFLDPTMSNCQHPSQHSLAIFPFYFFS